ncbi:MAG: CsiV family protein [Wenzhouxiangella sp.]
MDITLPKLVAAASLVMAAATLPAEEVQPFYRVEVIVFNHADGRSDARPAEELADFTDLLDPERRAAEAAAEPVADDGARDDEIRAAMELLDTLAEIEQQELMPELPAWPEPFLALEYLSERMDRAWQRLETSSDHEPLAWRAWHQPLSRESTPVRVRIHDDRILGGRWLEMKPTGIPALQALADGERDALMPDWHYRLDGGIRLRQRQFMHLDVDLHWRVPGHLRAVPFFLLAKDRPEKPPFQVHRLTQSRTVRPGRLEYFDSSWLGVLVLIEELEPLDGSKIREEALPDPEVEN